MTRKTELFSPEELVEELRSESRALRLPESSSEPIIRKVVEGLISWLGEREIVTRKDLERVVGGELEKYSPDLAYLYRNRESII
ncbi:hypothetical protein IJH27_00960 [Candidatus Saccharibacteria bacterium]|nr:hypothetical protein [Candidatus Saccharibacteria bacterium]